MEPAFNSHVNKGVLWDILMSNDIFKNNVDNHFDKTKTKFEENIVYIDKHHIEKTILEKNKQFIKKIVGEFETMNTSMKEPISAEEIKKQKEEKFNEALKKSEDEFQNSMKKFTPENIDFSDKLDAPIDNLNEVVEMKLKERKYESGLANDISGSSIEEVSVDFNIDPQEEETNNNFEQDKPIDIFSKLKPKKEEENEPTHLDLLFNKLFNKLLVLEKKLDNVELLIHNVNSKNM
jgi:hypothetical protein